MSKQEILRQEITKEFRKVLDKLGVGPMKIFVFFQDEVEYNETKDSSTDNSLGVAVEHPYLSLALYVPDKWVAMRKEKPDQFREDLFHEAFHVLLWTFTALAKNRHSTAEDISREEERLCDHLAIVCKNL